MLGLHEQLHLVSSTNQFSGQLLQKSDGDSCMRVISQKTTVEHIVPATQVQWGFPSEGDGGNLHNSLQGPVNTHCKKIGVHDTHVVCIWRQIWCAIHTYLFLYAHQ